MAYTWIPHLSDSLPFFQMDEDERKSFLKMNFGMEDGVCTDRRFDLPKGQSLYVSISSRIEDDRLDMRMSFGYDAGVINGSATLIIGTDGLVEISEFESEFDENGRYVLKDIVLILRQRFSPPYGSDLWGRDQFRISNLSDRNPALDDLIGQMATSLQQMVEEIATMVNGRLGNRYDEVANSISISIANRSERIDPDELRAATILNLTNLKIDAEISDRWKYIRMYGQACENFVTVFGIHNDVRHRLRNTINLGEILYDSIDRRRELDMGAFELKAQLIGIEQAENARVQAENTDRLSTFVAALTGVATILAMFQFIGDEVDQRYRFGCYIGSVVIVAIIVALVHRHKRKPKSDDETENGHDNDMTETD